MRRFKVGDKVTAFLDSTFSGTIVSISSRSSTQWISEGTSSIEFFVDVKFKTGQVRTIKMSELMHDDL